MLRYGFEIYQQLIKMFVRTNKRFPNPQENKFLQNQALRVRESLMDRGVNMEELSAEDALKVFSQPPAKAKKPTAEIYKPLEFGKKSKPKESLEALKSGSPRTVKHDLFDEEGKDTGMICGGEMEFFIEPLISADKLYIFGAGHIGFHLARMAELLGFSFAVIDDRQEFANSERFPNAAEVLNGDFVETAENLNLTEADYIVIITRNHDLDYEILNKVLPKPSYYLGLIGSKSKKQEIFARLKDIDGFTENEINKIHCPIGLDIGSETPEEIALSIMAEIIKEKRK